MIEFLGSDGKQRSKLNNCVSNVQFEIAAVTIIVIVTSELKHKFYFFLEGVRLFPVESLA